MPAAFLLILGLFILYLIFSFEYFFVCLARAIINGKKDKPFNREAGNPLIGIFGDSTGVGVGTSSPEFSLAGLLATHYPNATIINNAVTGSSIQKTIKILEKQGKFDIIVLCCIGIDILRPWKNTGFKKDFNDLFSLASQKSNKVIYLTPINLGLSPIFPWYLKKYYFRKSNKIGQIINEEVEKYPNIISENNLIIEHNCLIPDHDKISSNDRIHPNNLGYLWVYYKIKTKLPPT